MKNKFNRAILSLGIPQSLIDIMWAEMERENPSEYNQIFTSEWDEEDYLWKHTTEGMGWVIAEYIGYHETMVFLDKVDQICLESYKVGEKV